VSQFLKKFASGAAASLFLCLSGSSLHAQTPSLPPSPPAVTTFFPLNQIHRGLQGVAYTVFEGDKPEPMGIEVLGLLHDALGPDQDMILVRLEGAKAEYTGVVAGMSGSPVYIDGKLVGALSYRIGQFSKDPIGGVTPIQDMLQVRDMKPAPNDLLLAGQSPAGQAVGKVSATAANSVIKPIETPLIFSGFSPAALDFWKQHAADTGLTDISAVGGSASNEKQSDPLIPGSAVSAVLVSGDLQIAATCTVTYVDPHQMLACGHPITQFGPVSMPMTKAEVIATLASPMDSFKIINTTETIGSITEDRETAIKGVFGETARTIPVTLHMDGEGADSARTLHLQVIDQQQVTPMAVMVAVFQGLMQQNNYAVQSSYRVRGTVKLSGYPAVKMDNLIAPAGATPASLLAALVVGERFTRLYDNDARRTPVESVDLNVEEIPKRLTAEIESAHSDRTMAHAGDTITIEASLRPWHGELKNIRIPVTLPATLPEGALRILVSDGSTLDHLLQPAQAGGQPLDVAATIAQLNSDHPSDHLYVTLLEPEAQAALDGRTLTALPISMANVLDPLRQDHALTLHGESAVPVASLPVNAMLSGDQVVTVQIQ
jgi:hypothetical protein